MWARLHRWLAVVLVAPLVVWTMTGLLFHLKPGWAAAYEQLTVERAEPLALAAVVAPASLGGAPSSLELFATTLGPLYRVTDATGTRLVDARTGAPRIIDADAARALALDAIARSPRRAAYGEVASIDLTADAATVRFTGGATVTVDRATARLARGGDDTDRIDWLYRLHYLQWTGRPTVDRAVAVAGIGLSWAAMIAGLGLLVRRRRQRTARGDAGA
jgi:hypothetical protein